MSPLMFEALGVLVRWLLTMAGSYLVARHILTADQSDRFTAAIAEHILLYAPLAIPLLWALFAKYRSRLKLMAARELPAYASDHALAARMKTISVSETLREP